MKWFNWFVNKMILNKKVIKFYFIIALLILASIAIITRQDGIKKNQEYAVMIQKLKTEKDDLKIRQIILDAKIKAANKSIDRLKKEKNIIAQERDDNAKKAERARKERDSALAQIPSMTDDEIFQRFLLQFPQSGSKDFIVNENQVREVVTVSIKYKHTKEEIKLLTEDISNCNNLVIKGDSINSQQEVIITNLYKKDSTNKEIILNLSKETKIKDTQIKKEKRKLFWTKTGAGFIIVGQAIIIILNSIG